MDYAILLLINFVGHCMKIDPPITRKILYNYNTKSDFTMLLLYRSYYYILFFLEKKEYTTSAVHFVIDQYVL